MVSLWPWKGDSTSAASFEKTLSTLSSKITKANVHGDRLRFKARRLKALWTLYTIFAYILGCLILFLVTGRNNWNSVEYGVFIASPFGIYAVRALIAAYYNYRMSNNQAQVDSLEQQKEDVIQKLKDATKYNSTQELLEKYGGVKKGQQTSFTPVSENKRQSISSSASKQQSRTNLPPPPTANIPRLPENMSPNSPGSFRRVPEGNYPIQSAGFSQASKSSLSLGSTGSPGSPAGAEFAPNAFSGSSQYALGPQGQSRWYDRIMDVLLGDDETRAGNRLALICTHCRLVNGQAPPGTKRIEDVGRWRCSNCKEWNGKAHDVHEILAQASKDSQRRSSHSEKLREQSDHPSSREQTPTRGDDDSSSIHMQLMREAEGAVLTSELTASDDESASPPAKSTRSRSKKTH